MTSKVDSIVVGGGAGGLSMALLLAQTGKKTVIIEKSPKIGGALGCFQHGGYNLDAGFHFAGALQDQGIFDKILKLLGVREMISPLFLNRDAANIFHFPQSNRTIEFPYGIDNIINKLKSEFPGENCAIESYFDSVKKVTDNTPTLQMETLHITPQPIKEDYITLEEYLNSITDNRLLKEVLNALVMCHGSAPSEISMANNSRLCQGFYESISTISGGGASLVTAFEEKLKEYHVEIITSDEIVKMVDVKNKKVGKFILKSGLEFESEICVFTTSPSSVVDLLPKENFPPAFYSRVNKFEDTPGFFTLFASINNSCKTINQDSITSIYPVNDINSLSLPGWKGPGALAMIHSKSENDNVLTAFEPIYWNEVKEWSDSSIGLREEGYYAWKKEKTEEVMSRIKECFPAYEGKLDLITSSTPLTYRDYLNHHNGAAYGIKQKINQFNLLGQLRLRNLYVAGQSAILPGVLGTIMASILVAKNILGVEQFKKYLRKES